MTAGDHAPIAGHRPATARQIPPGASQVYVHDPAARRELLANARLAAQHSTAPQWVHEHPHGQPCSGACGPLAQAAP